MRRFLFTAAACALIALPAVANDPQQINKHASDGNYESCWGVQFPAGSSDWFNTKYDCPSEVACGLSLATCDFGAFSSFPRIGLYPANTGLDPSGFTPDTANPLFESNSPAGALHGQLHGTWCLTFPAPIHLGDNMNVAAQFPPGESNLSVSGDSDLNGGPGGGECPGSPNPFDSSAFTLDGYSTPAAQMGSADWGFGLLIDPSSRPLPNITLHGNPDGVHGDYDKLTTRAGEFFGLGVWAENFGPGTNTLWLLFICFLGAPIQPVGPPLPTVPVDKDGDGVADYNCIRVGDTWPRGAGGLTVNFCVFSGAPGVVGSVGLSNEVTVASLDDPPPGNWGRWDDCTYETGWVVSIPAGSSDYFSTLFDDCPNVTVTGAALAAMDFGTTATGFPSGGKSPPDLGVDPSGLSPDKFNPYVTFSCPVPPLTFVTTCNQMLCFSFAPFTPAGDVVMWKQFPPFDPGLLGVGGDTNGNIPTGKNGWTLNCFSTPANPFTVNWGFRCKSQ